VSVLLKKLSNNNLKMPWRRGAVVITSA
jgi:hypothetical protein